MAERPTGTRARILEAAERLFVERGYYATTLQEIADRLGITKPALYYHFGSKSDLLRDLLEPMTDELDHVLTEALEAGRGGGVGAVRTVLMTGWLEVFLRYRGTLVALMRDLAATPTDGFDRLLEVMGRALDSAAGPGAGVAERIVVAQAISAITDPVALLPGVSDEELREHLLAGVWRLLGGGGEQERPARRAAGGRPRRLSAEEIAMVRELFASGERSADTLAESFGVSRATIYRHLKSSW
ncbi:TetR family transcriptional regulator [Amycolatopsis cihanbeyliensis]|uniref:TetR family transcriptional regulator n=1 Tax=Amycolatopsis cihanbeyliensis TaxID=1128664 RepID=A0A542DGH5_AMYCI|nr:TetR family transcriptional regulator [Amycolatopsis cihanbeyliensis]TQJ02188.1 TetR family transcriptional regulator [Amycolatopsis cihanbeyliensis]